MQSNSSTLVANTIPIAMYRVVRCWLETAGLFSSMQLFSLAYSCHHK